MFKKNMIATGHITAAAKRWIHRICQVAPMCTSYRHERQRQTNRQKTSKRIAASINALHLLHITYVLLSWHTIKHPKSHAIVVSHSIITEHKTINLKLSTGTLHKAINKLGRFGCHFTIIFFLKKWKFVWNVISANPQSILPHIGILTTQCISNAIIDSSVIIQAVGQPTTT